MLVKRLLLPIFLVALVAFVLVACQTESSQVEQPGPAADANEDASAEQPAIQDEPQQDEPQQEQTDRDRAGADGAGHALRDRQSGRAAGIGTRRRLLRLPLLRRGVPLLLQPRGRARTRGTVRLRRQRGADAAARASTGAGRIADARGPAQRADRGVARVP